MTEETNPPAYKQQVKSLHIKDLFKGLAALAVLIPLITAVLQYKEATQQSANQNYRELVAKLSSVNKEERLAAAANLGTFIKQDFWGKDNRYDETLNILVNRVSIELDYNVLNAIYGSIMKINEKDGNEYKKIIEKLLAFDRGFFILTPPMSSWKTTSSTSYQNTKSLLESYIVTRTDTSLIQNIRNEARHESAEYFKMAENYDDIGRHIDVVDNFVAMVLDVTKVTPIEKLQFEANNLNYSRLEGVILNQAFFKDCALSASIVSDVQFINHTKILNTVFTYTNLADSKFIDCEIEKSLLDSTVLKNVIFENCKFRDVFFIGADLKDAEFKNAKGLKPIYFYKARNISKAKFEPDFRKKLDSVHFTDEEYKSYLKDSTTLTDQRIKSVMELYFSSNKTLMNSDTLINKK